MPTRRSAFSKRFSTGATSTNSSGRTAPRSRIIARRDASTSPPTRPSIPSASSRASWALHRGSSRASPTASPFTRGNPESTRRRPRATCCSRFPTSRPTSSTRIIAQRNEALASKLPVPAFPQAQGFIAGAASVWRIHAEATMPDGVTFVRDAVLRPSVDPRRPVIALLWQEGARTPPPPAPGTDADARAGDRQPKWPTPSLTSSNGCAIPRTGWDCPLSGGGGWPSSPRWCPRRRARRSNAGCCGPSSRSRRMPRCCGCRAPPTATLAYAATAHIPLAGDAAAAQQAGRAAIDTLPRVAYGTGPAAVEGRRRAAARPGAAQADPPARGGGAGPAAGTRLRSRSPHAVQAGRALLRRRGRRARRPERRNSRRLGGGVAQRGGGCAPARRKLGRDRRRDHARCAGNRGPRHGGWLASQFAAARGPPGGRMVAPVAPLGAACGGRRSSR